MTRILIVRMSALGDIVHALPVLAAIGDALPSSEVDWLVDGAYARLLDHVDGLTHRVVVRPGYVKAWRFLRSRQYHVALDLQGLFKSAAAARLAGARRVIGFERIALREGGAVVFYSEAVRVPERAHVVDKNLSVLTALGITPGRVRFPLRVPQSAVVDRLLATMPGGFALVNPGAGWPNKRWDPARFGELASRIRDRYGLQSAVLWGPRERPLADRVVQNSRGAAVVVPETTVDDLLSVTKAASLMVSGDTGPLHLAAAVRTPIVGVFGPTWPERNGPWDPADESVSRAHSCACHHKRECRTGRRCLDEITVDEVFAAVERRMARAGRA